MLRALALAALLGAFLMPPPGLAQDAGDSFGVSPAGVEVASAIAGQHYQRHVELQNRFDRAVEVRIETDGAVGAWTTMTPGSGFQLPAKTDRTITLRIAVPGDAVGTQTGTARFTALGGTSPDGTGYAIQYSVAVHLSVTLGGTPESAVHWDALVAHDIELGDPPRITATLTNIGNIATTSELVVRIVTAEAGAEVAVGRARASLDSGASQTLDVLFPGDTRLGLGTYLATAAPAGQAALQDDFKVVLPGQLGKEALLRGLLHDPRSDAGKPVRIEGLFVNTGDIPIGRARLIGEVHRDGHLVGTFESEPLAVGTGTERALVAHYTPAEPGVHILSASASYDGFQTAPAQSLLTVTEGNAPAPPGWLIGLLLGLLAILLFFFILWRRRRDDDRTERGAARRSA